MVRERGYSLAHSKGDRTKADEYRTRMAEQTGADTQKAAAWQQRHWRRCPTSSLQQPTHEPSTAPCH